MQPRQMTREEYIKEALRRFEIEYQLYKTSAERFNYLERALVYYEQAKADDVVRALMQKYRVRKRDESATCHIFLHLFGGAPFSEPCKASKIEYHAPLNSNARLEPTEDDVVAPPAPVVDIDLTLPSANNAGHSTSYTGFEYKR